MSVFTVEREMRDHSKEMETVARCREDVRLASGYQGLTLEKGEHFRLACLAMAALGQKDEKNPYRISTGEWYKVGPYVSQAVAYVLQDVAHTSADRDLVLRHALLINVARRGC
jgi:hypothetical protein